MLFLDRKYRGDMLDFRQKDLLQEIIDTLTPYEKFTDALSGEDDVTISGIAPLVGHLKSLTEIVHDEELAEGNHNMVQKIRYGIWKYIDTR